MAGEYVRWLARDVQPQQERELTPQQKRRNWWDYHKWHVIIGLVCAIMIANVFYDALENSRNKPDYTIAFVGRTVLPDDTAAALETAFAGLGRDLNGNGKVQVKLMQYQLYDETASNNPIEQENNAQRAYNASMLLLVNVETVESMIFLLEDPELFAANYPILVSDREEGPLWRRWADCPVLTGLELGNFRIPVVNGYAEGDSQKAMESIYIARRGLWDDESNEMIEGALELWAKLMEGTA